MQRETFLTAPFRRRSDCLLCLHVVTALQSPQIIGVSLAPTEIQGYEEVHSFGHCRSLHVSGNVSK